VIYIPAFALTGTADFSSIKNELQNLERTIGNLRVPQIKTEVATPNFSNFFSAIDKAEKQATIKIKPEIDKSFGGGLSSFLNSEKGKFNNVGKELGQNLTMGMQQQFGMAGGMASSLAQALGPVGIAATVAGAGVIALGAASVNAARGWETLMAGVSKTTGAEGAALTQLSNTLLNLSKEMPIAQAEIAKIATVGGTLGVKQSDLPKFVKDTAMASAGWGMSGEEAANSIAGISNAFKVPIADAQKFGSVINTMADNVGGSEKELADFLVRASGIATTFDEGIASTTAFGAVLASINMPMEVAATGLQSMMAYAMAPSSPERLEQWASMMNVTVDQLKAKLEQDLYGTLIESSNAIATVGTETEQQQARIAIWGEGGARVSSGLVGMQDKYTEALKMGNEQLATGSSLAQAFGAQGATVDAKWQKFTNTMSTALIHVGTAALPVLGQVLDTMSGLVAAADDFAATTLPAWAQSTTDWVNETLGMEEDTAEEATARKAKIARTREKTVAKVADTTGYQSYAEAQASAANLGQGTGNSYVDGLNSALDTGLPKALTDAYLGDALNVGKTAAAKAGQQTAEEFVKTQDEYIKSHSSGSYTSTMMQQMSAQQSVESGPKYKYDYQTTLLDKTAYASLENYRVQKSARKTDVGGFLQIADSSGNIIKSEQYTSDAEMGKLSKRLKESIRPVFLDMPKYIRQAGSDISDSLTDMLSDGVVSFEEKNELGEYIESLKSMKVDFPVEFDQANLDDQLTKLEATRLGLNVDLLLGTDKLESDFYKWAEENADVIATYLANNTSYMEATQGRPEYQWLELNPDAVSLMEEYNAALSSHEPGQVSKLPSLQNDLLKLHPELQDQAFWTTKVNVAQAELNEHFVILDGTVVGIDKDGKAVSEGFQAELPVLAAHGTGLIADAEAVASHTRSVLSSIAAMSNVHYGTLPTSANYALPGTTARAYNAYKPTTPIYAPLESLNLTKFAKGGISLTKGIAEVDANELHIPKDQLPCAVSSMYDVLENPNLFFPSGLGTITDGSGATYPTQAKLESLGKVIDTTKISFESANSGILKLSSGATYVSDRWMEEYDRFTITAPGTGFQSSSKRGYVPVSISDAAKENTIYNPFTDESNWQASGMDAKISAMQQQYAGKSSVMPSGANTKPDWIVEASNGIIPKYSEGVLNSLAVEYDSLQAVNTEKVRYADLQGTELRNILMQSDAIIDATAAGGEYCEAMSKFGIVTEETSRLAEKNGMFQKAYIGPSKYYEQAKEYFAGNTVTEAINKTTKQVSDVEEAVDESANEYGKYGRKLDALTDGLFATVSVLRGSAQSDLYGDKMPMSQSAKWYMDEFYTVEYGLGQCVSYLSDFAIMQEGVFSDVLFKPSYIGKTAGYAGAGKGGLPGYSNIAEILPQNALEMQEAASRFADAADMTDANYQLSKIGESSEATKEATEESAKELKEVSKNTQQVADQNAAMSDLYGQAVGGSSGWGGTSIGGGGGWIGTSGMYSGMNGSIYYGSTVGGWGAQASNSISGNTGTVSIGQGALYYAEGGITDHPVFGVFGEAGREAFVPISDRQAGLRILPQVMKELGVRQFASGGIVGSGGGLQNLSDAIGPTTITYAPVINGSGLSEAALQRVLEKERKKIFAEVAKKSVVARRHRSG
jgi:TP901 family phage tail tape measure protein